MMQLKQLSQRGLAWRPPSQHVQRRTFLDQRRIATANVSAKVDRLSAYTRDDEITAPVVRLKSDDGSLGQPQDIRRVIRNIDRQTETLVQIAKSSAGEPPIVQILSVMDLLKREREKEDRAKQQERAARDKKPKQIELNWAISGNDLDLKLKQLESFLDKGKKVEILLASKKRQRRASMEEGNLVLQKVRAKIADSGAKEIKAMEGEVLKQATLTVKKE